MIKNNKIIIKTSAVIASMITLFSLAGCGVGVNSGSYKSYTADKPYSSTAYYVDLNDGRIVPCWITPSGNSVCDFNHPKYKNSDARDKWLKENTTELKNQIEGLGLSFQDLFK